MNLKKDTGSKSTDKEERAILDKNFASINSTGENIVNVKDKNSNNKYSVFIVMGLILLYATTKDSSDFGRLFTSTKGMFSFKVPPTLLFIRG